MNLASKLMKSGRRHLRKRRLLKKFKKDTRKLPYRKWLNKVEQANSNFSEGGTVGSPPRASRSIDKKMLWTDYELHISLYKHYLTIVATFVGLYYTVTGVFLGYYFKNIDNLDNAIIKLAIIFPIMMSGFFTYVFYNAFHTFKDVEVEIEYIARTFGFKRPEVSILTQILGAAFVMFGSTGIFITIATVLYYANRHWAVLQGWLFWLLRLLNY